MEKVKETKDYIVFKKRNGRYGVKTHSGKWINGNDKVKILLDEGLIKAAMPKKEEEPVQEAATEEAAPESPEEPAPEAEVQA